MLHIKISNETVWGVLWRCGPWRGSTMQVITCIIIHSKPLYMCLYTHIPELDPSI